MKTTIPTPTYRSLAPKLTTVAARAHTHKCLLTLASLATLILTTGCIAPRSYVDAKYRPAQSGNAQVQNRPVRLTVMAQTNGRENGAATRFWKSKFEKSLVAAGYGLTPTGSEMRITINNLGDLGAAAGSGALTGLTFGAVGSSLTDRYVMTVQYGGRTRTYEHAIHSVIGNAKVPTGAIGPMSPIEAVSQVGDDFIRRLTSDLQ